MRGLAVLLAAWGVWLGVAGRLPTLSTQLPRLEPRVVAVSIGAGILGASVAMGLLGTAVPALALGLLIAVVPAQVAASRSRRRRSAIAAAWPDMLAHIRSSVSAGHTLPDAYIDAAQRIGGAFAENLDEIRRELLFGQGFRVAMDRVRASFDDPIADRVTTTLAVAHEAGGSRVGQVLGALSASIADETRLRSAHDAAMTEQRWTAGVALAAPWAILVLSIATNPQASAAFGTAEGALVVGIGFSLTAVGYIMTRRLATLSEPPRMARR